MNKLKTLLSVLGTAYADGLFDELVPYLADDCEYHSDYANNHFSSKDEILKRMSHVNSKLDETNQYSFEIIPTADILLSRSEDIPDIYKGDYCLRLHQSGEVAAFVFLRLNTENKIIEIRLSRDTNYINYPFKSDTNAAKAISVQKLLRDVYGDKTLETMRKSSDQFENDSGAYVWKQADRFAKDWLTSQGYNIKSGEIEDDCIGYRCERKNTAYTIFIYAYGEQPTVSLDGDYCQKLTKLPYAKDSIVLVLYLKIARNKDEDGKLSYKVLNYCGEPEFMDFWQVETVQGRNIFDFYPRKEVKDMVFRFIAAYNSKSIDTFEAVFAPNINIKLIEKGSVLNDGVYGHLTYLYENYGKMKVAYLRKNDVVFSSVPYLEGFGYFGFTVTKTDDKIDSITEYPLDEKYNELWVTDIAVDDSLIIAAPQIKVLEFLPPEPVQRFALKLTFENGELKKFVLPISQKDDANEVVTLQGYSFTDKIWRNGRLVTERQKNPSFTHRAFENYGQGIDFINGYSIGKARLYSDSTPFVEPAICEETVFENEDMKVVKFAEWKGCALYRTSSDWDSSGAPEDAYKVSISGSFNWNGISTLANADGSRATNIDFCYMDSFCDGLLKVAVDKYGYGFVGSDLTFAIPPKYSHAKSFSEGFAIALTASGERVIIDKEGNERLFARELSSEKYKHIRPCKDRMFAASLMNEINFMSKAEFRLAYFHDDESIAGNWGFVNANGIEVIPPQYIFAHDFEDGIALVCKGKWEYKDKWDDRDTTWGWWSEEMLWGFIDKEGNEVIPCIYDEIQFFQCEGKNYPVSKDYFKVHIGGYPDGKWRVINKQAEYIDEMLFEYIGYELSQDGCFSFRSGIVWSDIDETPQGVYSIPEKRVLLEPQFLGVDFFNNGNFCVETFDETLRRNIYKIIDRNGNVLFDSIYSSIYERGDYYEVSVFEDVADEKRRIYCGLVDKNGKEILPCKYETDYNGISIEREQIICKDPTNGKYGLINFDETIVIPPQYGSLSWTKDAELLISGSEEDDLLSNSQNRMFGLLLTDGTEVLPIIYGGISIHENTIIAGSKKGSSLFRIIKKSTSECLAHTDRGENTHIQQQIIQNIAIFSENPKNVEVSGNAKILF